MELPETQNSRDARIEALWKQLDPKNKGRLDLNGLKKGLQKIDHRKNCRAFYLDLGSNTYIALKNADDMLQDVIKAMDKNGDQVIEYDGMYRDNWNTSADQVENGPPTLPILDVEFPGISTWQIKLLTKGSLNIPCLSVHC